ncbi:MAG: hypothetical protein HC884_03600 [Chloroflexaceae bacterium]|nr:hypothetical protein [Chloroflexaceae bacterium]
MTWFRKLFITLLPCLIVAWVAGPTGRLLVVLPLLLFGPGYLLDRVLRLKFPAVPFLRPSLWLGLSLCSVALLYEWATVVGLVLSSAVLHGLALSCAVGVVGAAWQPGHTRSLRIADARTIGKTWLPLLLVFLLSLGVRLVQIRDLVLPAWVDSVHHALIIRVAAEQGQAPYSLRPYLPVDHLSYHWGYHVFTAAVMHLSGLELPRVMLWEGQVLNALHVLTCASLATCLWRRPLAGVVAGIVVGLVSIMPSYYVSWGRYTLLTGLLVLPPLAISWHLWLRTASRGWLLATALLLAGLSIIHALVLVLAGCLLAVMGGTWALDTSWALVRSRLWQATWLVGGALVLAAPWLWVLSLKILLPAVENPHALVSGGDYVQLHAGLLWEPQKNLLLISLALVALLWGTWHRAKAAVGLAGWVSGMVVLANPWMVGYILPVAGGLLVLWSVPQRRFGVAPGGLALLLINPWLIPVPHSWIMTNDIMVVCLFIPLSVLIGGGAQAWLAWLKRTVPASPPSPPFWRVLARGGFGVLLAAFALWGAKDLRDVINPVTVLATPADTAAMAWVAEHTPPDARFLINAVPWYPGDTDRGTDGGYWLLPLTGRWTTTPPAVFTYGPPDYVREVRRVSGVVASFQEGQEQDIHRLIEDERITHIYLGPDSHPLSPALFDDPLRYEQVYTDQDGSTIFAVHHQVWYDQDE